MLALKTRVMIWGRAAARCSLSECRRHLVIDESETDDPSLIGEICHIVAESDSGPRGESLLTQDERNKYGNLILMCSVHHKLIDDQPNKFTVAVLEEIKKSHETFVKSSLDHAGRNRLRAEEIVAGYIDVWSEKSGIEEWNAWTSWLLSTQPNVAADRLKVLQELPEWLFSRIWPRGFFPQIEKALSNYRGVLNDLLMTFRKHSEPRENEGTVYAHITKKFYRIDEWNPELYARLGHEFDCHVSLIGDYVYELTRAANYVCDAVREELSPDFRIKEGALLVTRGMDMNLEYHTYRPEYRAVDFPDLYIEDQDFIRRRLTRDVFEGTDEESSYLEKLAKYRQFPIE